MTTGPAAQTASIEAVQGDITRQRVDAIVNAANGTLLGGGGVDGAIHRAAGPELLAECRTLGGCPTGEARITRGYRLPARWVLHAVGPVWHGGGRDEDELLAGAYRACFALARQHGIATIAFPAISTGAFGFPRERAARIALAEARAALAEPGAPQRVLFVCFDRATLETYQALLAEPPG
ncbi:MAG: O-acetyl-ADP-ribose deacetylase [Candidatus Lambdaproteobacteria bacterium]|nr:O-acetyl-ADP-ribose deacetylase [Candidatus Lambdaproteobacteria bacterium]